MVMSGERLTPARRAGRARAPRLPLPHDPSGRALSDRDRRGRPRLPPARARAPASGPSPACSTAPPPSWSTPSAMVEAAERLYGPYRWGRYDVIVLPPSFPYGGMENPTLTFLTPTFIAGDRSLVGLVAHELAHSWSGNLVTNAVWSDSWLNEGVTSYFENRIMEELYGPARAGQEAALSWADMEAALRELGADRAGHAPPRRRRSRRRQQRHRLRQGRDLPAHDRAHRRAAAMGRLSALLFRPPRLRADDLGALPRRSARQPRPRRRGAGGSGSSSTAGSISPACRTMRRGPIPPPSPRSIAALRRVQRRRRGERGALRRLELGGAGPLPQGPAARSCRGAPRRARPGLRASRRAAMPRCCSPGCGSRSATATSRRCRSPSDSSRTWAAPASSSRCSRRCCARAIGAGRSPSASMPAPGPTYHSVTRERVDRLLRRQS